LVATGAFLMILNSCKKEDPLPTVNDIDGNAYHTVSIGAQVWMVENLKTTKLNDGTAIPLVTDPTEWENLNTEAYCWYDNNNNNKNIYGALYNWNSVNSGKLCPTGWHVPTRADWEDLRDFLGGEATEIGGKLKEKGTSHWESPNTGATDEYGFKALPGGERYGYGDFNYLGTKSNMWSSTASNVTETYALRLFHDDIEFHFTEGWDKKRGLSVRCIKN
jgi:uncharacterized protein (TIGR02145 family)